MRKATAYPMARPKEQWTGQPYRMELKTEHSTDLLYRMAELREHWMGQQCEMVPQMEHLKGIECQTE